MKYDLVLLDVDNTLIDFDYSEKKALENVFFENKIILTDEILEFYKNRSKELWEKLEKGAVSKDFVLLERFNQTFEKFGLHVDAEVINCRYQIELGESPMLYEGAIELCRQLVKECRVAIVTNGTKIAQDRKLELTGLNTIIEDIFISEDIGYNKPDKRFFDYIFSKVGDYRKDKVLIVGDSLTSDIRGGNNIGIDTCWVNMNGQKNTTEKVDCEINELSELLKFIR